MVINRDGLYFPFFQHSYGPYEKGINKAKTKWWKPLPVGYAEKGIKNCRENTTIIKFKGYKNGLYFFMEKPEAESYEIRRQGKIITAVPIQCKIRRSWILAVGEEKGWGKEDRTTIIVKKAIFPAGDIEL